MTNQTCPHCEGELPGGWISVKERLPEFDTEVLMFLPDAEAGTHFLSGEYQSEHECDGYIMDEGWVCIALGNEYEPTHWMPLPPAPKEEQHD